MQDYDFIPIGEYLSKSFAEIEHLKLMYLPNVTNFAIPNQGDFEFLKNNISDDFYGLNSHVQDISENQNILVDFVLRDPNPKGMIRVIKIGELPEIRYLFLTENQHDDIASKLFNKAFVELKDLNIKKVKLPPVLTQSFRDLLTQTGCTVKVLVYLYQLNL